ncbi:MAG: FkbM family methyltransferase [Bacteroidota bacterium]
MKFLKQLYRSILPYSFRVKMREIRHNYDLKVLRKKILRYFSELPKEKITDEQLQVIDYLKNNKVCTFPYDYQFTYNPEDIKVYKDNTLNMNYVLLDNKRLYFKRSWDQSMIKSYYNLLLIEQDIRSPHLYLTDNFYVGDDSIIADIGVAEGNFSLSVIEKAKKIYLFETNEEWIEALEATFAPWKSKVNIINKYVSDKNDSENVSLDFFLKDKERVDFLKIDVDGAEEVVLKGCENLLKNEKGVKVALCTYHQQNDEKHFAELLNNIGFSVSPSNGYMIFYNHGFNLEPPYLRRGLIRATK